MRESVLAGDHYELGRSYGSRLKEAGFSPAPASEEQLRFADECEAAVREHAPQLLNEMRGVADGGGFDPGLVKVLPLTLYEKPGCSVVAASGRHTTGGKTLFGRNYDFFRSFAKHSEVFETRPEKGTAHVGCSDHWVGRHDGVNEAGLAIGHSGPPATDRAPGFVFTLAVRAVLERCRDVAEASAYLERIPHLQNTAFLLADAAGNIAAVDASVEETKTTWFGDGFGFLANHFASEAMARHQPEGWHRDHDARDRDLRRWFEGRPEISEDDVRGVLADPETGACACADEDAEAEDPDITLWSWTAVVGAPSMRLAKGNPAEVPYVPIALAA